MEQLLAEEAAWGIGSVERYADFAQRTQTLRASLRDLLVELRRQGKRVAAYGAAAKGAVLLNASGLGADLL